MDAEKRWTTIRQLTSTGWNWADFCSAPAHVHTNTVTVELTTRTIAIRPYNAIVWYSLGIAASNNTFTFAFAVYHYKHKIIPVCEHIHMGNELKLRSNAICTLRFMSLVGAENDISHFLCTDMWIRKKQDWLSHEVNHRFVSFFVEASEERERE